MKELRGLIGLGIAGIVLGVVFWGSLICGGIYFALWALKHFGVI